MEGNTSLASAMAQSENYDLEAEIRSVFEDIDDDNTEEAAGSHSNAETSHGHECLNLKGQQMQQSGAVVNFVCPLEPVSLNCTHKTFKTKVALWKHIMRTHHRKPNEVCPNLFSNRTTSQLTEKQQNILKENRDISIYPTDDQISIIAQQTRLSPYSIKKWFNSTRYTERKEKKKNRDNLDNPASYCAFSGNARSNILTCSSNQPTMERINMDKDIDEVSPLVCPLAPVSCTDKTSKTRDGLRGRRFTEKRRQQLTILRANFDISIYPTGPDLHYGTTD